MTLNEMRAVELLTALNELKEHPTAVGHLLDVTEEWFTAMYDEVFGEGAYAATNKGNPDPGVQVAIQRGGAGKQYDARNQSGATLADCQAVVGSSAILTLTGKIVEAGESDNGAFVKFEPDPRWGFPAGSKLGMDLEAFRIER